MVTSASGLRSARPASLVLPFVVGAALVSAVAWFVANLRGSGWNLLGYLGITLAVTAALTWGFERRPRRHPWRWLAVATCIAGPVAGVVGQAGNALITRLDPSRPVVAGPFPAGRFIAASKDLVVHDVGVGAAMFSNMKARQDRYLRGYMTTGVIVGDELIWSNGHNIVSSPLRQ